MKQIITAAIAGMLLSNAVFASCIGSDTSSEPLGTYRHEADISCTLKGRNLSEYKLTVISDTDKPIKFYTTQPHAFQSIFNWGGPSGKSNGKVRHTCHNTNSYLIAQRAKAAKGTAVEVPFDMLFFYRPHQGEDKFECRLVSQRAFKWSVTDKSTRSSILHYIELEYQVEKAQPANFHRLLDNR